MSEGGKGTAVGFSGDQQPQLTANVPQPTSPLATQASPQTLPEKNARVDAVWQQMNKGISKEKLNSLIKKSPTNLKGSSSKPSPKSSSSSWMTVLGLGPKQNSPIQPIKPIPPTSSPDVRQDSIKVAAAALSAVKDAANMAAALQGKGKIEVREVRDFAGEAIEVKKLVDGNAKEATEKEKGGVDAILEQIKKKPKLSVLDKTKKDWGEFKEENQLDEELETYKKSGNQYLDKQSFLQRADYREFERERDARLAVQAKRKADMQEDD